ncbi:hypothetical protein ACSBR1_003513 [Camellia fascicularis]
MSTHDAVLTDISHVEDEVHIEASPPEREGEAEVMVVADVVAELIAITDLRPETGSGAAQAGEGGSHSQAPLAVSGGPYAGKGVPQDTHLQLKEPHIQRVYGRRPRRDPRSGLWDWG